MEGDGPLLRFFSSWWFLSLNSTARDVLTNLLKSVNSCADSQFCIFELRPLTKRYCFHSSVSTSS